MLVNKNGLVALTSAALLIAASNANALTFRSDQQSEGGRMIYHYVATDPDPTVYPSYTNNDGRRVQPAGEYGIGGTEYANGVRFIHSNGGNPITMNITADANTPAPIDNKYLGNSTSGVSGTPFIGIKSAGAKLTPSSNGVIAGTSLSDGSIISESSVLSFIDSGDITVPGGHTRESYAALFSGSEDPYEISTSFNISFTHQVILDEIFFDKLSHNGSSNVAPNFEIVGGSNNVNTGILATQAPSSGEGSTIIPGTGGSDLGALFLANEVYTIKVYSTSANSLAEFKRWNAIPSNIIVSGVPYITSRISSAGVSSEPEISANARFIVFQSDADNLVAVDTNNEQDIFVYDQITDTTSNISLSSAGTQGNDVSENPDISGDGNFIVFASLASNLDASDTNLSKDIFIHDQSGATTTKISRANDSSEADDDSSNPAVSADGRYVVFESAATNLVGGDNNGNTDIFLYDSNSGLINLITANGDGSSTTPDISADSRYVAFESSATNLVTGLLDDNGANDIFVYEIATGITTLVSTDSISNLADNDSFRPAISADGRYIAFDSLASNLVSTDTNSFSDVFVHDRLLNETTRISVDSFSTEANGSSINAAISANGDFVSFESTADDLVPSDSNNATDIFVRNRLVSTTERMSVVSFSGNEADQDSTKPGINFNGRDIAFASSATDLVSNDSNNKEDVFLSHNPTISSVQYLIVTSKGTGSGTFSINPTGTDCGDNSTSCGYYPANTTVTITATPAAGDLFVAWSGCTSTAGSVCTVTMDDYKNVIAQFDFNDPGVNHAPTLTNPGNQNSTEGSSINLSVSASDVDGDVLTFSATGLPTGLSINSTSGLITGTITTGSAGGYNPTVTVSDGQLNTPVSFLWTVTLAGVCGPLTQEAEVGILTGNFVVANDAAASGGQFIEVPNGNGNQNSLSGHAAEYCFTVTTAGTYRLNTIVRASGSNNNSFFVTVDGSPSSGYLWDARISSGFTNDYVNQRNGADPVEFVLAPGEHTIVVYQREDGTQLDRLTLELQGAPANTPPSVTNPGTQSNIVNDNISLAIVATDVDNDPLTYSASGLPTGLSINNTSGLISGTVTTVGNFNVSVTVNDGANNSVINFIWNVIPIGGSTCGPLTQEAEAGILSGNFVVANDASASGGQFIEVPNGTGNQFGGLSGHTSEYCFTVTQAGTYRLNTIVKATGSNNNSFFVTVDGSPSSGYLWDARVSSGFTNDYVNQRNGADPVEFVLAPGEHTVLVYLREDGTQLDQLTLELQGAPANTPPSVTNPGTQNNLVSDNINLVIVATDVDNDPLTYSASGLPTGLSINNTSGLISGTVTTVGNFNVSVTVNDGTDNSVINFVWDVIQNPPANTPPNVSNPGTQNNLVNDNINLVIVATDVDNDPLTYSASGLPAGLSINNTSGLISGTVTTVGNFNVSVTVNDGTDNSVINFVWDVIQNPPANTPPNVSNPGTQNNLVNDNINLVIVATDVDNDPLTYSASGLPAGLSINNTSGLISGTVTTVGNFNVSVTVNDGTDNSVINFVWDVIQNPPANTPPNVSNPGTQNNLVNDNINLVIVATDVDNDPLTYSASGLPAGLSINNTSGLISGTVTTVGNFNVSVTVNDGTDNSVINFVWDVIQNPPANTPPNVTNPGNQSNTEGSSINLSVTASDVDGDTLTFSATGLPTGLSINSTSGLITGTITTGSAGGYNPTVTVSDGQLNTPVSFLWTVTLAGVCGPLTQEAEVGILTGNFVVANDAAASGGQFIEVPNGNGNQNSLSGHAAEYCFTVTTAGTYRLNTIVRASGSNNNSFFVTVDGSPSSGYLWDARVSSGFTNDYVNQRNGADPVEFVLAPGEHTIVVYQREDGTQLDRLTLELQGAPANTPPSVTNPGTQSNIVNDNISLAIVATDVDNDPLTYSASGLPTGLSINNTSGLISGTVTTVGNFNVSVTVNDGANNSVINFIWNVIPIGGSTCGPLTQEAEAGILSGNFVVANDASASGGQFIEVPNGTGNQFGGLSGHTSEYCFTVTQAGTYRLNTIVKATGSNNNSFFVTVDGSPSSGYLWDARVSSGFTNDYVNQRNGADPVEFVLAPGEHTVLVYLREDGTQLDQLTLELQ